MVEEKIYRITERVTRINKLDTERSLFERTVALFTKLVIKKLELKENLVI